MSELVSPLASSNPRQSPRLRRWLFALLAVVFALTLHWLLFQGREVVPGVIARPLGWCDVEWFGKRDGAVVIACPHTDLIKLWPLPVEQPWHEDPPIPLLTAEVD
jgi:hypothetical protein